MKRENCVILNKKIAEGKARLEVKSKEYEDTLATVCEKWIKEKTRLEGEMRAIDDEIEELQRRIMQKRYEKQDLERACKETIEEINSIRINYKDREDEIAELNRQIVANEQDSAETKQAIEDSEATIRTTEKSMKTNVGSRTEVILAIEKVKEDVAGEYSKLAKKIEFRERIERDKEELETEFENERAKVVALEGNRLKAQDNLAKVKSRLKEMLAKIMSDKIVLSQMEDEKKASAAARKFKEASKVSSDIKNLQKTIETAEAEVEAIKASKAQYETSLGNYDKELGEFKGKLENTEKELNKNKYHGLKHKIEEIKELEGQADEQTAGLLEAQETLLRDELKEMTGVFKYLEECEYKQMSPALIRETIQRLTEQAKALETEINELSQREEYEEADMKQQALDAISEKLETMQTLLHS
eukprot:TRINITY_DN8926_c0_g1_i4.p1 TRINITY_DN8926_c0_g1~~TRINITY_DN8926_c0_g1_i4.p1  ORF type:complete len:417 (-),score=183.29 TRINITY_DN8926_c0_g1_i4:153-1403(-)